MKSMVVHGKRPDRWPPKDQCVKRGLDGQLCALIEECWNQQPEKRPTAAQVAEQLRFKPNLPIDDRLLTDWDASFPSQLRASLEDKPFCASLAEIQTILFGQGSEVLINVMLTRLHLAIGLSKASIPNEIALPAVFEISIGQGPDQVSKRTLNVMAEQPIDIDAAIKRQRIM
jgi:hypothetical protein